MICTQIVSDFTKKNCFRFDETEARSKGILQILYCKMISRNIFKQESKSLSIALISFTFFVKNVVNATFVPKNLFYEKRMKVIFLFFHNLLCTIWKLQKFTLVLLLQKFRESNVFFLPTQMNQILMSPFDGFLLVRGVRVIVLFFHTV